MDCKKQRAFLAASVAGLMAATGLLALGRQVQAAEEEEEHVPCYGINKCKGTGDCGGKAHACAGKNECAGQGFLKLEQESCLKIKDGRLTPEPEPS